MADIHSKLIARRTRKGHNVTDSAKMLSELTAAHTGDNLVAALVYEGFATEAQAEQFVKVAA